MLSDQYAKGISAENLRLFLELWPKISTEVSNTWEMILDIKDKVINDEADLAPWCFLYELPIKQHIALATATISESYSGFLNQDYLNTWHQQILDTPGQIGAVPEVFNKIDKHFDSIELSAEAATKILPKLATVLGIALSQYNTLRCVLYHGCFLNELIERVRTGDDKALFDAIRLDSTVIGCISVSTRIGKATLLQDNRFFAKLKAAINGKMAKREQANFQKMRLVFEVLHEAGASHLSDAQLYQLFVEELKLYAGNTKGGGNTKALRKLADTYMKKSATT